MLDLMLYNPLRAARPRRGFNSWFFGPDIIRRLEAEEAFVTPRVDVSETEDRYVVTAELPGFGKDEINIEVKDGRLSLSAEHNEEKEEKKEHYTLKERRSGRFFRTFTLPDNVDENRIEAKTENGILTIDIGKKEKTKPRQIEVDVH